MTRTRLWSLFHSMAAYYPVEATEADKQRAKLFLHGFMDFGLSDRKESIAFAEVFRSRMSNSS